MSYSVLYVIWVYVQQQQSGTNIQSVIEDRHCIVLQNLLQSPRNVHTREVKWNENHGNHAIDCATTHGSD